MSVIRRNLMEQHGYSPYCGNNLCREIPRTSFDGEQFVCPYCGWRSEFPADFIVGYKAKWTAAMPAKGMKE